jgi:hypothetical protein
MFRKILFFLLAIVTIAKAQSPTAFRQLDLAGVKYPLSEPEEYNWWAGGSVFYPIYGDVESFDLTFGIGGKLVMDFFTLDLARTWHTIIYGNFGLPNYNVIRPLDNVSSISDGLSLGVQAYTVFGSLKTTAFTFYLNSVGKLNTFQSSRIYSYRFGVGGEFSMSGGDAPVVVGVNPTYVLLANDAKFVGIQNELDANGFWTSDTFVILPVGDKFGLLAQATLTEKITPLYRIGVILAAGL